MSHCRVKRVRRGEYLVQPGEYCQKYYFIHQGLIRAFVKQEKKEVTTWISMNNEMVTSIYSMLEQKPSIEYIQAIRESVLLELDAHDLEKLYEVVPTFNTNIRKLITAYYQDAEMRSYIARMPSATSRCSFYLDRYPEKALLAPKKYIASFLGIREETLSRALKKRK